MAEKRKGRQARREESTHHQTVFVVLRREQCPSAQDYPDNNGFRKIKPLLPDNISSPQVELDTEILEIFAEAAHYRNFSESFAESQGLSIQSGIPNKEILRYRNQVADEKDASSGWHHAYNHLIEGL